MNLPEGAQNTNSIPGGSTIQLNEPSGTLNSTNTANNEVATAIHGWTYQLKLLMLIFIRAVANNYENFKINTENETDFDKFDDAIFQYDKDGKTYIRLVQIKHVKDESKTIKYEELGPYEQPKKYKDQSKYKLTKYFESFLKTKKEVENFIIFTNLSLAEDVPTDLFAEIQILDDIFDFTLPDHKNMVENCFQREYKNKSDGKQPKKLRLDYNTLTETHDLYNAFIKIAKNNNQVETPESLVEKFCKKFIFSIGQPNDNEMNSILENEISRISELPISELISAGYLNIFLDWLNNKCKNGAPLTHEDMKNIIPLIKFKAENLSKNLIYEKMLKDVKYEDDDTTINKIKEYFKEEDLSKTYLLISTKFPELTLSKIFQCLDYTNKEDKTHKGECAIIEVKSIENVIETTKLKKYFKFCVIIFHVELSDDYMNTISKMVEKCQRNVVILIKPESGQHLEDDCSFNGLTLESKNKILKRNFLFETSEIQLSKLASINLLDQFQDTFWLSELIVAGVLVLNKKTGVLPDNDYIERILYYTKEDKLDSDYSDYQINCYDHDSYCRCESFAAQFSEQSITDSDIKLIILSSQAGMGKTALLSSISQKNKQKSPNSWTEIIKLTEHVRFFPEYNTIGNYEDVIEFISTKILLYNSFTVQMFKHQIEAGNAVIMFDGFDEISKASKDVVLNIIENLLKTNVKQIWITSRPLGEMLEKRFSRPSIKLRTFSKHNVIKCFSNYFAKNATSNTMENASDFIDKINNLYHLDLHVPLYTKMAAEYFISKDIKFSTIMSIKGYNTPIRKFYENFIKRKYSKFLGIKIGQLDGGHAAHSGNNKFLFKKYDDIHKNWAMQMLYPEHCVKQSLEQDEIIAINSIGIASATVNKEDDFVIQFDHRTFAEYFVAKYLIDKLSDGGVLNDKIFDFLSKRDSTDYIRPFLQDAILPNKIILTTERHIKKFKEMLDEFLNRHYSGHFIFLQICFDNFKIMEDGIDDFNYFKCLASFTSDDSFILFDKFFKKLSKKMGKQMLKSFLIKTLVKYEMLSSYWILCWNERSLKIFKICLKDNFIDEADKPFIEAISNICDYNGRGEGEFIEFCQKNQKSNTMDNFSFCLYTHNIAIRRYKKAIQITRKHLIEASEDSKLDVKKIANKLYVEMEFNDSTEYINFYKTLTKVFKNQKSELMNFLEIPSAVFSFDEFEMLLIGNIKMFTENLKLIIKVIGVSALSLNYYRHTNYMKKLFKIFYKTRSYFEKLFNYNNEELLSMYDLFGYDLKETYLSKKLSESQIEYFHNHPIIMEMCFKTFIKMIVPQSRYLLFSGSEYPYRTFINSNLSVLGKVFDENSELYPYLVKHEFQTFINNVLNLDSLQFLKKVLTALDEHNIIVWTKNNYSKELTYQSYHAKEYCSDFFLEFVKRKTTIKEFEAIELIRNSKGLFFRTKRF